MAVFGLGAICRWGSNEKGFADKPGKLEYQRNVEIRGRIIKQVLQRLKASLSYDGADLILSINTIRSP